jgi:hypothetical protein
VIATGKARIDVPNASSIMATELSANFILLISGGIERIEMRFEV